MQLQIKMALKLLQGTVWAVCLASAGGALADDPQKVTIYTNTNPMDWDPMNATKVLETVVVRTIHPPYWGDPIEVWGPQCVAGAPPADCQAAMDVYNGVQDVTGALNDRHLGPNGTMNVIIMKNNHPDSFRGLYYPSLAQPVVLYPNRGASTLPHEVAHVYVHKHVGTQSAIKGRGVNEGFARITAHRVAGVSGASPPSADNVPDILNGPNCATQNWQCSHDLGNLVFEAYNEVVSYVGTVNAYNVYRDALRRLTGSVITPASLHEKVGQILEERYPRLNIQLPNIPDPFDLPIWDAWWQIFWLGVELC